MSERTILDSDLRLIALSDVFSYVILVELSFPSGSVYAHNSVGTLSFGGNDYLGVGAFGSIGIINESKDLVDKPVNLMLSSIDSSIIDALKVDDVYGRDANIYVGALDEDNQLLGTPTNWISGYMDSTSLTIGSDNSVTIKVQTKAAKLKRKNNKRWTLEDHQRDYPGDQFFEYLPWVILAQPSWGGEKVRGGFVNDDSITGGPGGRTPDPDNPPDPGRDPSV